AAVTAEPTQPAQAEGAEPGATAPPATLPGLFPNLVAPQPQRTPGPPPQATPQPQAQPQPQSTSAAPVNRFQPSVTQAPAQPLQPQPAQPLQPQPAAKPQQPTPVAKPQQ